MMENIIIKDVKLNFGGFYNSDHSDLIDSEIESILESENLSYNQIFEYIDYKSIYLEYSKRLVDAFNDKFDLFLKFEQLVQPREYNFYTDVILVEMNIQDYNYLFVDTDQNSMQLKIQDVTTSSSGYTPLYTRSELLNKPQFIAEFLLDIVMQNSDYTDFEWFYEDNYWFYEIVESAIDNFREKENK